MECLPALRLGRAGWVVPLSVPAAEFLAALLLRSHDPYPPSQQPAHYAALKRRSPGDRPKPAGFSVQDYLACDDEPWIGRACELLRADWALRWYVLLQQTLKWSAIEERPDLSRGGPRRGDPSGIPHSGIDLSGIARKTTGMEPTAFAGPELRHGTSRHHAWEARENRSAEVSVGSLAAWFVQHARDWFGNGDSRLVTGHIQACLPPDWCDRWQQAAEAHAVIPHSDDRAQPEESTHQRGVLCQLLELSGHAVPVAWKESWPRIIDQDWSEPAEEEEEWDEVGLEEDEQVTVPGDAEPLAVGQGGQDKIDGVPDSCLPRSDECSQPSQRLERLGYGQARIDLDDLVRLVSKNKAYQDRFAAVLHDEKIESLKQLAYGLSHELNNPLAAIRTRAELLARLPAFERNKETLKQLQRIVDSTMRAHEMIADLMYFAKPPRPHLKRIEAIALTEAVVDEYREVCEQLSIVVTVTSRHQSIRLIGDPHQLADALRALLRNAIDAVGCAGAIDVHLQKNAHQVRWMVSDSGAGMSEEARRHAFDPYYSGREAGRGLGLGLSRVYRVARSHGGKASIVNMASHGGVGCQFRFWIPRKPSSAGEHSSS